MIAAVAALVLAATTAASGAVMKTNYGLVKQGPRTVRPPLPHTLGSGQYNTELSTTHQFKLPRRL